MGIARPGGVTGGGVLPWGRGILATRRVVARALGAGGLLQVAGARGALAVTAVLVPDQLVIVLAGIARGSTRAAVRHFVLAAPTAAVAHAVPAGVASSWHLEPPSPATCCGGRRGRPGPCACRARRPGAGPGRSIARRRRTRRSDRGRRGGRSAYPEWCRSARDQAWVTSF